MKNKFIRISDLYQEVLELFDNYNLERTYNLTQFILIVFEALITCSLKRTDWSYSDYIRLYDVIFIKDGFDDIFKILFRGEI